MTPQQLAAYALVLLMPLSASLRLGPPMVAGIHWLYVTPGIEAADLAALLLVFLTLLAPPRADRRRGRLTFARLTGAIAVLGLLSAATAYLPPLAIYTTARWALAAAVCWAVVEADLKPRPLFAVLVGGLAVQALIGIGQLIHEGPLGLPAELTMRASEPGAPTVFAAGRQWLRIFGLTFHPNVLGGYLAVGLIVALPLLDRMVVWPVWWLMSGALLATFSRSAWLAAALIVPTVAAWLWRREPRLRRGLIVTLGAGACVVLVLGWAWHDRIFARLRIPDMHAVRRLSVDRLMEGRSELNRFALQLIAKHPLLGIGAGNSPLAAQRSRMPPHYPHNVPLMLGAEIGLGGPLLWFGLLALAIAYLRIRAPDADPLLPVAVGALVAVQIIGLFDCYPWSLNAGRLLTVLLLSTIELAARPSLPPSPASAEVGSP